jgi:hypothetical protein
VGELRRASSQLQTLIYRSVCPQLIGAAGIATGVAESGWDSKSVDQGAHAWVHSLFTSCAEVWLEASKSEGMADAVHSARHGLWLEVCGCAFETALEAMVRAKRCSREGRVAMNS